MGVCSPRGRSFSALRAKQMKIDAGLSEFSKHFFQNAGPGNDEWLPNDASTLRSRLFCRHRTPPGTQPRRWLTAPDRPSRSPYGGIRPLNPKLCRALRCALAVCCVRSLINHISGSLSLYLTRGETILSSAAQPRFSNSTEADSAGARVGAGVGSR